MNSMDKGGGVRASCGIIAQARMIIILRPRRCAS
jgi:hypothetical protein